MKLPRLQKQLERQLREFGARYNLSSLCALARRILPVVNDRAGFTRELMGFLTENLEVGSRIAFNRCSPFFFDRGARTGVVVSTQFTLRQWLLGETPYPGPEGDQAEAGELQGLDWPCCLIRIDPCKGFPVGAVMPILPTLFKVTARPGDPGKN